jgi:long-subunit fatty acid transport protein
VNTNYNLNYRYQIKNGWSFGGGIQYFVSENNLSPSLKEKRLLLNVGKKISESLNFRVNTSFRSNETQANKDGYIINGNVSLTYQIKKKHNFSLNTSQLIRKTTLIAAKNETRFRVNYNYNF